jgi:hypothetical protein
VVGTAFVPIVRDSGSLVKLGIEDDENQIWPVVSLGQHADFVVEHGKCAFEPLSLICGLHESTMIVDGQNLGEMIVGVCKFSPK